MREKKNCFFNLKQMPFAYDFAEKISLKRCKRMHNDSSCRDFIGSVFFSDEPKPAEFLKVVIFQRRNARARDIWILFTLLVMFFWIAANSVKSPKNLHFHKGRGHAFKSNASLHL